MAAAVRDAVGPISILLNNAANDKRHAIEVTTPASGTPRVAVNLKHQFFVAQAVVADMKGRGGGSIVNLGSVSWKLKHGGMPVYTTSQGRPSKASRVASPATGARSTSASTRWCPAG